MAVISIHGITVADSVEVAYRFSSRFKGLMLRKSLPLGGGMLLTPCSSIHMLFMRMSLDIVYLSQNYTVLAVESHLKPWRVGRIVRGCRHVLELPAGQAALQGITPGEQLAVRTPMGAGKRPIKMPAPSNLTSPTTERPLTQRK